MSEWQSKVPGTDNVSTNWLRGVAVQLGEKRWKYLPRERIALLPLHNRVEKLLSLKDEWMWEELQPYLGNDKAEACKYVKCESKQVNGRTVEVFSK